MTKPTDMQLVLLTTAAARTDGSLLPPAESLGRYGDRIRRSVDSLIKKAFATEISVKDDSRSWREDAGQLFGVAITDAGRTAIGCGGQTKDVTSAAGDKQEIRLCHRCPRHHAVGARLRTCSRC